jgi:hypothetical protein
LSVSELAVAKITIADAAITIVAMANMQDLDMSFLSLQLLLPLMQLIFLYDS